MRLYITKILYLIFFAIHQNPGVNRSLIRINNIGGIFKRAFNHLKFRKLWRDVSVMEDY